MTTCTQCQSEILNEKEPYRSSSVSIEKAPRRSLRSRLSSAMPNIVFSSTAKKIVGAIAGSAAVMGLLAAVCPTIATKLCIGIGCVIAACIGIWCIVKVPFYVGGFVGIHILKFNWKPQRNDGGDWIKHSLDVEPWGLGVLVLGGFPGLYFLGDVVLHALKG